MRGALFHQMMPSGQSKFEMAKMTNWGKMGDRQKPQWQRKIPVCDGTVAEDLAERLPPKAVVCFSGLSAQCSNQQDKACGLRSSQTGYFASS